MKKRTEKRTPFVGAWSLSVSETEKDRTDTLQTLESCVSVESPNSQVSNRFYLANLI